MNDVTARDTMILERQPRVVDPVSPQNFKAGDYEGLQDQSYQFSFVIKSNTLFLKGRQPLCAIINTLDHEMADLKDMTTTTASKGMSIRYTLGHLLN